MKKYKEAPWWWYAILLVLSFFAGVYICLGLLDQSNSQLPFSVGLIVIFKGQTTLPWWSYIVALILGTFVTVILFHKALLPRVLIPLLQPFSTLLFARMGSGIATNQLMKMVAGAINPGRPVANLYVSMTFLHPSRSVN